MEVEQKHEPATFVHRVLSLPLMTSAIEHALDMYSRTKDYNKLFKFTLEKAETAVKYGAETATPIMLKFTPSAIDNFACQQLDKLESAYPIITKPPTEIMETSFETINDVKNYSFDRIIDVKNYGYDKVDSVKNYGYDKVDSVKNYGYDKVDSVKNFGHYKAVAVKDYGMEKIGLLTKNVVVQKVLDNFANSISCTEKYIDQYLPPVDAEKKKYPESLSEKGTEKHSLVQAMVLSDKIRLRLQCHAQKHLNHLNKRAQNKFEELQSIISALKERSVSNFKYYNSFVHNLWSQLHKDDQNPQKWKEMLLNHACLLTKSLTHIFKQMTTIVSNVSANSKQTKGTAKQQADNLYDSFKKVTRAEEISKLTFVKAQQSLHKLQGTLQDVQNVKRPVSSLQGKERRKFNQKFKPEDFPSDD